MAASVERGIVGEVREGREGTSHAAQGVSPQVLQPGVHDAPLVRGVHEPAALGQFLLQLVFAPAAVADEEAHMLGQLGLLVPLKHRWFNVKTRQMMLL